MSYLLFLAEIIAFFLLSTIVIQITRMRNLALDYKQQFQIIKSILHPPDTAVKQLLEERAHANRRLVRALGLSNTFVSPDEDVHKEFVADAHRLLGTAQRKGWHHFQSVVQDAIQWHSAASTTISTGNDDLDYASTIQTITLYAVLVGLLGVDPAAPTLADASVVCAQITTLWAHSKGSSPVPAPVLAELQASVRRLAPDANALPAPLNFVVPTWETLWRVVAATTAHAHTLPEARGVMAAFVAGPSDAAFRADMYMENGALAPRDVVAEAMRLTPPSKRIGRARTSPWVPAVLARCWDPRTVVKADVGALLASADLWGADCCAFVPGRQSAGRILPAQKEAMGLAFGQGPLRCVAASWAPVAAAVIVGTVFGEYRIVAGAGIGGREGWKGWFLRRRSCRDTDVTML